MAQPCSFEKRLPADTCEFPACLRDSYEIVRYSSSPPTEFWFFIKIVVSMILFATMGACIAEAQSRSDELLVRRFFELREQVLDQRGTSAKVDQLLSLFKNGGHYEHPAFSVNMTLDEARSGMLAHLREGRDAKITINRFFHGANFTIAETTLRYFIPDDSGRFKKVERNGVAIFEMQANRIVRVAEY